MLTLPVARPIIHDLLELTLYHADLIEALGLESPHIVGHYSGAMVAAEMAAIRAVDMSKLVLADPAGLWQDENPGRDYNTTPAIDIRQALFADPDSEDALSMYSVPKDDRRTWMADHPQGAVAKHYWQVPMADSRQGTSQADSPDNLPNFRHHGRP